MAAIPVPDLLARPETERECEICWEGFIWLSVDFFWIPKNCIRFNTGAPRLPLEEGRHHRLLELEGIIREEVGISHLSFTSGLMFHRQWGQTEERRKGKR